MSAREKETVKQRRKPVFQWLGTAGFRMTHGDRVILIDPFLSRNERARPVQDLEPSDLADAGIIFLSHGHFDHIADVPAIVSESDATVHCSEVAAKTLLEKGVSDANIHRLFGGEKLEFDGLQVDVTTCHHIVFDARLLLSTIPGVLRELPSLLPQMRGMPAGPVMIYTFKFDGLTVTHMGSLGMKPVQASRLASPDILIPCLQGHTHICERAAELTEIIRPRAVVPQHFDDFFPPISRMVDLEPFRRMVEEHLPECAYYKPEINREFGVEDIFGGGE